MAEIKFTKAQEAAINHCGGAAVVSAGAGSGKTAVLAQRVVKLLCDEENPLDPSRIAVVTFTEKAAGELKTRLASLMNETAAAAGKEKARFIKAQSRRLHGAKISTISSFCFSMIRENIELADGVSAGFSVIDQTHAELLKNAVLETVLEDFYKNGTESEVACILENYVQKNDLALCNMILRIYNKASNRTDPLDWLDRSDDMTIQNGVKKSLETKAKVYADSFKKELDELYTSIGTYDGSNADSHTEYADKLDSCYGEAVRQLCDNDFVINDEISELSAADIGRAPSDRSTDKAVKEHRERAKSIFAEIMKICKKITSFDEDMAKSLPAVTVLKKLVISFAEKYAEEKRARNRADFSDAERVLYNMLLKHPELSERAGLQLIIVDEFQDSNRLQYEIFRRLSGDSPDRLYFVGDIKQSIYGFRGAEPEVFAEVSSQDSEFTVLPLNENFRSRRCVIDGINTLFDRMMTPQLGGADYAKDSRLICGTDSTPEGTEIPDEYKTEVCIVAKPGKTSGSEYEAAYIAQRISDMINSGFKVGKDRHACTEDDFAIIMRSPKSKLGVYTEALRAKGIGFSLSLSENFTDRPEIRIMLDQLRVIDDPYNDESLAKLLMSVIYGFSADDMARLRTGTFGVDVTKVSDEDMQALRRYVRLMREKPLYSCILAAADGYCGTVTNDSLKKYFEKVLPEKRCAAFIEQLDMLRTTAASCSVSELIRRIYDTTPVLQLLSLSAEPETRLANLELLITYARNYCDCSGGGTLTDLLDNIDKISSSGGLEAAKPATEHGVRLMSIHASKGLQFPVVFVSDCSHQFNDGDYTGDIIISNDYGICSKAVDTAAMSKIPSPAYDDAQREIKKNLFSEEMRLLYVAATRAEDKLIFTGCKNVTPDKLDIGSRCREKAGCEKGNYLDWFLDVLALDNAKITQEDGFIDYDSVRYIFCSAPDECDDEVIATETASAQTANLKDCDDIIAAMTSEYEYEPLTRIAARYTATELASNRRKLSGKDDFGLYIKLPSFMENTGGKLSGKRRGDAYHKLMEHIPFDRAMTIDEAQQYIINETSDFLSDAERDCIDAKDISRFFESDIATRLINSGKVYREHPIFHKLTAQNFDAELFGADKNTDLSGAEPYVQGIADLFFIEDDGIVLIDYKSDRFTDEQQYIEDYKLQLDIYEEALAQEFSMPVKQKLIYSFRLGKTIEV